MNIRLLEQLGYYQTPHDECAAHLNITIEAFRELLAAGGQVHYDRGKGQGLYALRVKIFDKAVKDGDNTMLAQLGKAHLNQGERSDSFDLKQLLREIHDEQSMLTKDPPVGEKS